MNERVHAHVLHSQKQKFRSCISSLSVLVWLVGGAGRLGRGDPCAPLCWRGEQQPLDGTSSICAQKVWRNQNVYWLQGAQLTLSQRCISTTTPWWSSRPLGWVDSIFNPRPSKWILAIATAPWWLWEDSILPGTRNGPIPVSPNAFRVIRCSKFLSEIDG